MKHTRQFNEENERLKRRYLQYLRHAKGQAETSIGKVAEALLRLESCLEFKAFGSLNLNDVEHFKETLSSTKNLKTGKVIASSTRVNTLVQVRAFFHWLADQIGYKSVVRHSFAESFSPSRKDQAIARSARLKPYATAEQAAHAFAQMPAETLIERRDRAIFSLMMLTGARVTATASLKVGHVDLVEGCVFQDGAEVATKGAKTFTTWFVPVDETYHDCLAAWIKELREELLFGPTDPLFPKPKMKMFGFEGFKVVGLSRLPYTTEDRLRSIIKQAFATAGLPPYTPHRFRNTIVRMSNDYVTTAEELKAVSMNLGHSKISTTIDDYGQISPERQGEVMKRLREKVKKAKSEG